MDAHALDVRRDRAVDEREATLAGVLPPEGVEAPLPLPEVEHAVLELGQVELRADLREARPGAGASAPRPALARLRHAPSFVGRSATRPLRVRGPLPPGPLPLPPTNTNAVPNARDGV